MDPESQANLASQLRQAALQQAAHDYRGNETAEVTVKRAETYYAFLKGALHGQ